MGENGGPAAAAADVPEESGMALGPEEDGVVCAICLEPLADGEAVPLSCKHSFHPGCIVPWLQQGNRSCPTCRNKPPRQHLDGYDDSEDSYNSAPISGDESEDDLPHQALHDAWDITWSTWLSRVDESEREKRRAIARAKRLAQSARPRDAQASKEARRLLKSATAWKAKAEARTKERSALEQTEKATRIELRSKQNEAWKWYEKRIEPLRKKTLEKVKAAELKADLPGIWKKRARLEKAMSKAATAHRDAEEKLAKGAGWTELGPVPQLPPGLRACLTQPLGPPWH